MVSRAASASRRASVGFESRRAIALPEHPDQVHSLRPFCRPPRLPELRRARCHDRKSCAMAKAARCPAVFVGGKTERFRCGIHAFDVGNEYPELTTPSGNRFAQLLALGLFPDLLRKQQNAFRNCEAIRKSANKEHVPFFRHEGPLHFDTRRFFRDYKSAARLVTIRLRKPLWNCHAIVDHFDIVLANRSRARIS